MARRFFALLIVPVLATAACGDSAEEDTTGGDGGGSAIEVKATDFQFEPSNVEVEPGTDVEITFVNGGNVSHTFTAEDLDVDVEAATGEEAEVTFKSPDEDTSIEFVCSFHPSQMTGTIVVGGGGDGAGAGTSEEGSEDSRGYDY